MSTPTMIFTGGEPMLRKDLFQIVEHALSRGLAANIPVERVAHRPQRHERIEVLGCNLEPTAPPLAERQQTSNRSVPERVRS